MENKEITVNPQPTAVIVQPATPVVVEQAGCCCVPSTASGAVKAVSERGKSTAGPICLPQGVYGNLHTIS